MARYKLIACHVLSQEFCHYAALSSNEIELQYLEQGLHNTPDRLRRELQAAVDTTTPGYDVLLIGYALCSNGVIGLTARQTPIVLLRGHDCVTFLLGSKERYRTYFDAHPGTYWFSPGWIDDTVMPGKDRYEQVRREYVEKYGEDNADYLMGLEQQWYTHYSNAAYIDVETGDATKYRSFAQECAHWLGWQYDELKGDSRLIKSMLDGKWDSEDFLVLKPGEMAAPTYDERILEARPASASTAAPRDS